MEKGELVSDDLIVALVRERIGQRDARGGFILDGFPRTLAQAGALESTLAEKGDALSAVVNFSVPEKELTERRGQLESMEQQRRVLADQV